MIDIHCHIVPNIDDGAKNLEDALEMAKIAYSEGIRKIVNTSHYHPNFEYINGKELFEHVREFNDILKSNNIDIEVLLGNELYYSEDIIEIIEQKNNFKELLNYSTKAYKNNVAYIYKIHIHIIILII